MRARMCCVDTEPTACTYNWRAGAVDAVVLLQAIAEARSTLYHSCAWSPSFNMAETLSQVIPSGGSVVKSGHTKIVTMPYYETCATLSHTDTTGVQTAVVVNGTKETTEENKENQSNGEVSVSFATADNGCVGCCLCSNSVVYLFWSLFIAKALAVILRKCIIHQVLADRYYVWGLAGDSSLGVVDFGFWITRH